MWLAGHLGIINSEISPSSTSNTKSLRRSLQLFRRLIAVVSAPHGLQRCLGLFAPSKLAVRALLVLPLGRNNIMAEACTRSFPESVLFAHLHTRF